jgi:hypothetical protein
MAWRCRPRRTVYNPTNAHFVMAITAGPARQQPPILGGRSQVRAADSTVLGGSQMKLFRTAVARRRAS